jgi:hypothetical protein
MHRSAIHSPPSEAIAASTFERPVRDGFRMVVIATPAGTRAAWSMWF